MRSKFHSTELDDRREDVHLLLLIRSLQSSTKTGPTAMYIVHEQIESQRIALTLGLISAKERM